MRRTYRSKKDTGCGLDPKDMLQNVDEKCSTFDAFYIQNIKQTKREMSCIGSSNQYGVASNKVRKRKYVKRIIKEVEPAMAPRESLSQSVFLTPDKSIRVNKAYDPFDMLLNSSLASKGNKINVSIEKVQAKGVGKTYTRRQLSKAKKFNYSSTDSSSNLDSDKEYSDVGGCNTTSNTSDIRKHELLVEGEQKKCPKYLDDSIKNIVNNISLLNNINQPRSTSGNIKTSFKFKRNRLTTNIQSPILQKSPLCSTPFKSKYRGDSIFKLSPISVKDQEDSPHYVTYKEEHFDNNGSFIFVSNSINKCCKPTSENHPQPSVVTCIPDSNKCEINNKSLIDKLETQSNESLFCIDNTRKNFEIPNIISNNKPLSNIEISSIQTTEVEPFFGFCDNEHEDDEDKSSFTDNTPNITNHSQALDINETETKFENVKIAIAASLLSDSQDEEKESLYDTCSSEQSSSDEEIKTISIKPIVEIERLKDSLFLKYYEKMTYFDFEHEVTDNCLSDNNKSDNNDDSSSYESNTDTSYHGNSLKAINKAIDTYEEIISSNEDELDLNNEEDRLISFVTTRKRNEVTNIMSILDESNSSSIYNYDYTVLGASKNNLNTSGGSTCNDNNKQNDMMISVAVRDSTQAFNESACPYSPEINADCTLEESLSCDELNVTSLNSDTKDTKKFITVRKSSKIPRDTNRSYSPEMNEVCKLEETISDDDLNITSLTNNTQEMRKSTTIEKSYKTLRDNPRSKCSDINVGNETVCGDEINANSFSNEQNMRNSITIRKSSRTHKYATKSNSPEINAVCKLENTCRGNDLNIHSFTTENRSITLRDNSRSKCSEMYVVNDTVYGDELNDDSFTNEQNVRNSITIRKSSRTLRDATKSKSPEINAVSTVEDTCRGDDLNIHSFTTENRSITLRDNSRSKCSEINVVNDTVCGDELNDDSFTNEQNMRNSITTRKSSRTLRDATKSNSPEINAVSIVEDTCRGDNLNIHSFTTVQNTRKSMVIGMNSRESAETLNSSVTDLDIKNRYSILTTTTEQERIPASPMSTNKTDSDWKPIVLQPGKKWERSLSIYRRMSMITDHFDQSILEDEPMQTKGRKYRQSVISTMEMQELSGLQHNESINSRRSTFISKPYRSSTLKDTNSSRVSLSNATVFDDSKGFLNDECDDTIIELSKLSIADAGSEVTVLDIHDTSDRIATARDYVLRRCNQTDAILFDECYPDTVLKNCQKIGEGVYGEVFLWRDRDGRARVMKIVPVAGDIKVNGENQKQFHEIISEIEIAMELSALRTPIAEINLHLNEGKDVVELDLTAIENATDVFNEVRAVRCVYGSYPSRLLDLWDLYDECKGSENDNPAILPVDQQYIVLELANAGQDLESYQFNNAEQAHALFLQVAFALAVGEEAFQFEHRDLHWGNVLIAPTDEKLATFVVRGRAYRVQRCGVAATVIDYSLSRLSPACATTAPLYNDLSTDDGLFDAVGDYQFEVYRLMRDKLGNDWKNFEPYTNILWLHYTVDKMITALRYKRINTKIHKHYIEKLKGIKNRILQYGSTVQFVLTDNEF